MSDLTAPRPDLMAAAMQAEVIARHPLVIRFDMLEAVGNMDEIADELHDDGSNRGYVIRRIKNEIQWLYELMDELESVP